MNYTLLWGVWFIWALALLAYCLQAEARQGFINILLNALPLITSLVIILSCIYYRRPYKGLNMFKRKETFNENSGPAAAEQDEVISVKPFSPEVEKALASTAIKDNEATIIPSSCHINGEVNASGDIRISGSVNGTIKAVNTVHVLHQGNVEGDIYAEKLVVDGKVTGTCISESVEINANGYIDGTIESDDLSINKSGHFYGVSKPRRVKPMQTDNVAEKMDFTDKTIIKESSLGTFTLAELVVENNAEEYNV